MMNYLQQVTLGIFLWFCAITNMSIGIMFLLTIGHELDGSRQFWIVTIATVTAAMSLFIHGFKFIYYKHNEDDIINRKRAHNDAQRPDTTTGKRKQEAEKE